MSPTVSKPQPGPCQGSADGPKALGLCRVITGTAGTGEPGPILETGEVQSVQVQLPKRHHI